MYLSSCPLKSVTFSPLVTDHNDTVLPAEQAIRLYNEKNKTNVKNNNVNFICTV